MREAGVTFVTARRLLLGAAGAAARASTTFGWLDRGDGPAARATASPSTWPPPPRRRRRGCRGAPRDPARSTADGAVLSPGGRQALCPSSPVFRERALALVDGAGARGTTTTPRWRCGTCPTSSAATTRTATATSAPTAFRGWLRARYGDARRAQRGVGHRLLEPALRRVGRVLPPRTAPTFANPTQQLDFAPVLLRRAARRTSRPSATCCTGSRPGVPVTTNFMVMSRIRAMDYCAGRPSWTSSRTTTTSPRRTPTATSSCVRAPT